MVEDGSKPKESWSTTEPEAPFEPIPRPQGPFRSGQDNQEPIYDNSGIKIGADFGSPGDTVIRASILMSNLGLSPLFDYLLHKFLSFSCLPLQGFDVFFSVVFEPSRFLRIRNISSSS
ncbi:MAG: hypothetical protein ACRD8W_06815, partial [Nitrososphaeraceae archaeon]